MQLAGVTTMLLQPGVSLQESPSGWRNFEKKPDIISFLCNMVNLIIKTFKRYAWFKRLNAKITYELLAKFVPAEDWHFMNYGYEPNADEAPYS